MPHLLYAHHLGIDAQLNGPGVHPALKLLYRVGGICFAFGPPPRFGAGQHHSPDSAATRFMTTSTTRARSSAGSLTSLFLLPLAVYLPYVVSIARKWK